MRRPWHHSGDPRGSRRLHRVMAESLEERQTGDIHRRQPRTESHRSPARLSGAGGAAMSRAPFIAIEGKHYLWKDIIELRRTQLAAACAAHATQMALFDALREDHRPVDGRTASEIGRASCRERV